AGAPPGGGKNFGDQGGHGGADANRTSTGVRGEGVKAVDDQGSPRLDSLPSSRTGENPPYGMIGRIEETSASSKPDPRLDPTRLRDEDGQPPHLLGRRRFLHLAACAVTLPAGSRVARSQNYPARPVRIIVGFSAGGTTDIIARLIAQGLSERLGQQFIIENRPGASANLATEAVVRAPPDGYTLLAVVGTNAINATLYDKLSFNLNRDIAPVAGLTRSPLVLEVHPSVPAKTVSELVTYAKAHPGKITMASFGVGSTSHVAGELFKMMAGVDLLHVPYRGSGPMLTDLVGGQVQMAFDNLPASIEHIRAGKLRALAV